MKYLSACAVLLLAGCTATSGENKAVGMANPASVYCEEQGGRVEIRQGPNGQIGYCHLPDGRVVEEWELFRAASGPA